MSVVAFAAVLILLPIFNLISVSLYFNVPVMPVSGLFGVFTMYGRVLLVAAAVVGVLLLMTRAIGWYALVAYASLLVVHNSMGLMRSGSQYAAGALSNTLFAVAAVAFFMRKDIRIAYLAAQARGWRQGQRFDLITDIIADGQSRKTANVSDGGARVLWSGCERKLGDEIEVTLTLGGKAFSMKAGIARIDEGHVAVAFRGVDSQKRRELHAALKSLSKP